LGRTPVPKGRKGRPETVCWSSLKGIEVYTGRMRIQALLARRCPIGYVRRTFAFECLETKRAIQILRECGAWLAHVRVAIGLAATLELTRLAS